jgi:hypothetical protein
MATAKSSLSSFQRNCVSTVTEALNDPASDLKFSRLPLTASSGEGSLGSAEQLAAKQSRSGMRSRSTRFGGAGSEGCATCSCRRRASKR